MVTYGTTPVNCLGNPTLITGHMVTYGTTPVNCLGNPTLINKKEDNQQRSLLIIYNK